MPRAGSDRESHEQEPRPGSNSARPPLSYLTSKPHALGKSLERLVALTSPQKGWHVLDVATGGGHVAYAFRAARRARLGHRHHPGNARYGERPRRRSAACPTSAPHMPKPKRCLSKMRVSIWSPAASRRTISIQFPTSSARSTACSSRMACSRWSTMSCRKEASAITSMPSSASAIRATCEPGPCRNGVTP